MNSLPFQQILFIIVGGEKESNESPLKAVDTSEKEIGEMKGAKNLWQLSSQVQSSPVQSSPV